MINKISPEKSPKRSLHNQVKYLDTVTSSDSMKSIDQNSSTFSLSNPDQGLPGKTAKSRGLTILREEKKTNTKIMKMIYHQVRTGEGRQWGCTDLPLNLKFCNFRIFFKFLDASLDVWMNWVLFYLKR